MKNIFLLTLLLIPTLVFAIEDNSVESDSPWNFDIQYDYISLGDSYIDGSKKITTINLLLDSRLDENTTIHGDFYKKTTKSDYSALLYNSSVSEKGIRELYIESEVTPNTTIMVGKKSFRIDNKKGIQDLGVTPLLTSECATNQSIEFNKCVGIDSAYIKSELSDNLQIELLKTTNDKVYPSPIKGYKARFKYSTDEFDYYLTTEKDVQDIDYNNFYILNNDLSKSSIEFSLKENLKPLSQWFIKAKHTKNDGSYLPPSYTSAFLPMCLNNGFVNVYNQDFLHSNSLALGKVFTIDKLLINAELNHNISTYNSNSNPFAANYVSLCPTQSTKKIKSNTVSLMLEYPIKNGQITSSHLITRLSSSHEQFGFFPNINNINSSISLIDVTYNFTKHISGKLGYQLTKFEFWPGFNLRQSSVIYGMKYKF
jgi:hypothetical protein